MHTKNGIFLLLLLLLVIGAGILLLMSKQASEADLRRKRDADAYAIRNALVFYMQHHNGALPSSLADLSFERSEVDPSPFILFDPETRKGQLGKGVIAEAEQAGSSKHRIVIYADGTVHWE